MFETAQDLLTFLSGGNAKFTIQSKKTGKHFTFKVSQGWDGKSNKRDTTTPFFVSVLNGPDNEADFMFIGFIPLNKMAFRRPELVAGRKGRPDAPSFKALDWVLKRLTQNVLPEDLEVQHEGHCCRCGRTLTHPDSLKSGIGPECRKHF